jgi:hypothetical protein
MAIWALVEAQNSSLNLGDARGPIGDAIGNGVESILTTQQKNLHGLSGWWPNPSVKNHPEYFAGLTAQVLLEPAMLRFVNYISSYRSSSRQRSRLAAESGTKARKRQAWPAGGALLSGVRACAPKEEKGHGR